MQQLLRGTGRGGRFIAILSSSICSEIQGGGGGGGEGEIYWHDIVAAAAQRYREGEGGLLE